MFLWLALILSLNGSLISSQENAVLLSLMRYGYFNIFFYKKILLTYQPADKPAHATRVFCKLLLIIVYLLNLSIRWFHGAITSDMANTALSDSALDNTSFLIRLSTFDPLNHPYTLSLKSNEHKRISRSSMGYSMEDVIYPNLFDIVARNRNRFKVPAPKVYKKKY